MVKPDGDSPEYTIWMSEIGQTDVVTGQQIFSNPYIGTAFISANSVTWTPLQTEDLKFNIYRAKFQNVTGTVTFENEDDEFLTVDGFTKVYSNQGIQVGDEVRKLSAGVSLVGPLDPYGVVQSTDEAVNSLVLDTSNGKWTVGDSFAIHRPFFNGETTIGSLTMIAWGTITEIRNRDYSVIVPRFASLEPVGASIAYKFKGMANTGYIADSTYVNVTPETDNEFNDQMRTVASKSNEVTLNSGNKSAFYQLTLNTINDFVSPVLDLTRKTSYVIRNDINNDITNEHTRYGNALTRYLSKPVVLAENQDAEDIMVYLTAYRPAATDLNVYIKFLNAEDTENFDTKVWTKLNCTSGASVFSSTSDKKDFKEYEFSVPSAVGVTGSAWLNGGNFGIVQYAAASGAVYIGYKTFMIKVVPTADSRARVPFLKDLRALCLQK
jgi:hypothetical protein